MEDSITIKAWKIIGIIIIMFVVGFFAGRVHNWNPVDRGDVVSGGWR